MHCSQPSKLSIEQNALKREPYAGRPEWRGRSNHSDEQLREILQIALRRSEQLALHVVGDAETDRLIATMEALAAPSVWKDMRIRIEHECAHYFTRRCLGSVRNNALDEVIADYAGLVGALRRFRADWFLRFIGLEEADRYRPGARLENYRGDLSDPAFTTVQHLSVRAAHNLESLAARSHVRPDDLHAVAALTLALVGLSVEELASDRLPDFVGERA